MLKLVVFIFFLLNDKTINAFDRSMQRTSDVLQSDSRRAVENHLDDPVHIGIFNGGQYQVHVMINYIYNDLQKETYLDSKIVENDERTMFLPHNVTNIRIRIQYIGVVHDGLVVDEQIPNFDQIKERCYVLAGTRSRPIYGLCPRPFEDLIELW